MKNTTNETENIHKNKTEENSIFIKQEFFNSFINFNNIDTKLSEDEQIIKLIIDQNISTNSISCRKIANIFFNITGKKKSKSNIYNIITKRIGYKYLKTITKNSKLLNENYIKMKKVFLKIILRALLLKFNIVYIDESKIQTYNNNYRCWRTFNKTIYSPQNKGEKVNLIMAVSQKEVLHSQLTSRNIDSNEFIKFLSELKYKMSNDLFNKSLFILDNARFHTSLKTEQYLRDKKFKILTIVPYMSQFDSIELSFRFIKNIIYKRIFSKISQVKDEVKKIIESNELKKSLKFQFKETLNCYLSNI